LQVMGAAIARDAPPVVQTMYSALLRTKLELALAGLDASGKTTLVSVLRDPAEHPAPTAPTIGLVVQRARHRGIDVVLWDLGGHHRFRDDWGRHVRGCGALLFVVDASDPARFGDAPQALQRLLEDPLVAEVPLLVLANKVDLLPPAVRATEEMRGWATLAQELNLDCVRENRWSVLGVSATRRTNLDKVMRWLVLQAHGAGDDPALAGSAGDGGGRGGGGRLAKLWDSLLSWSGRRRSRWGGGAGFSFLADSLLPADEAPEEDNPYHEAGG
jgi:ADP-ribosylation factor-like protein 8